MKVALCRSENVGKGGNAGYYHVLLFPQCFRLKDVLFKGPLTHSHTMTHFDAPGKQAF